ncbi:hypothetical protein G7Y89_g1272 [Cudoniella acicularis]|uniref:Zn(2)-C6 fungal-type domain-containing protein n=1 Tax=Cudoniella acicularis TaxID=354080 RepID=A0A8H4W837_9HELO|nr:hypothetical protein G7Y89_g1272 [Cudoniella acicularis]
MPVQRQTQREACDYCHNKKLKCETIQMSEGQSRKCRKCFQGNMECTFSPRQPSAPRRRRKTVRAESLSEIGQKTPNIEPQNVYESEERFSPISPSSTSDRDSSSQLLTDVQVHFSDDWNYLPFEFSTECFDGHEIQQWALLGRNLGQSEFEQLKPGKAQEEYLPCPPTASLDNAHLPDPQNSRSSNETATLSPQSGCLNFQRRIDSSNNIPTQNGRYDDRERHVYTSSPVLQALYDLNVSVHKHALALPQMDPDEKIVTPENGINHHIEKTQSHTLSFLDPFEGHKLNFPFDDTLAFSNAFISSLSEILSQHNVGTQTLSFLNTPASSPDSISSPSFPGEGANNSTKRSNSDLDDAATLLILSCYLSLLKIYDAFFAQATQALSSHSQCSFNLPGIRIGSFTVPLKSKLSPHFISFTIEIAYQTYVELRHCIESLRVFVRSTRGSQSMTCIAETTLELVQGRERLLEERIQQALKARGNFEKEQVPRD